MPKRVLQGVVVSDKNAKTLVVKVERRFIHPVMGKTVRRSKKYHAHDEGNEFKAGETVRIEETAPISKLKTWKVLDKVDTHSKPKGAAAPAAPASAEG
jgi:small subunit ribosomal protein S17